MKSSINRRSVLQAIGAGPVLALPAVAGSVSNQQTEIERLYANWLQHKDDYVEALKGESIAFHAAKAAGLDPFKAEREYYDKHVEGFFHAMTDTEKQVFALKAETMADQAIKSKLSLYPWDDMDTITDSILADADRILAAGKGVV